MSLNCNNLKMIKMEKYVTCILPQLKNKFYRKKTLNERQNTAIRR